MRYRGGNVDCQDGEGGAAGKWAKVDIGQLNDGEGAEGEGVFRVGYWSYEICGEVCQW